MQEETILPVTDTIIQEGRVGEQQQSILFRPKFNRSIEVRASEAALSEDAGVLVLREVAGRMGLDDVVGQHLSDRRSVPHVTHSLASLVRTSVFMLAQGWTDQDDADALREDLAFRIGVADRRGASVTGSALASQPTLSRTIAMLADDENRAGLHVAVRQGAFADILRTHGHRKELTIDIDSFPQVAHGHQEGAAYNGHYHDTMFHPIAAIADTGHFLAAQMRPGNVHTAKEARAFVAPLLDGAREIADKVWLRFDAGYVASEFMDWLDEERVRFVSRIRNNNVLKQRAEAWVARTRAAWSAEPADMAREDTFEFWYKADKWREQRRIVAVLVERVDGDGELFDRLFFLITNAARPEATSLALLARYRQRGRAENHIGELVNVIGPKVSLHHLASNEVVLLLGLLAYNLVHHIRGCLERRLREGISLQRVRERFLKAASHVVRHARRVIVRIGRSKADAWRQLVEAIGDLGGRVEGSTAN